MKVAVCSTGDTLDSPADPRFGRCAYFVIVDTETFDASAVENPGAKTAQGAGIQAAQVISSLGVSAIITGNLGSNAHQMLSAAGVKAYTCAGETVRYAIDFFNAGSLAEISAPTGAADSGSNAVPGQGLGQGPGMGMGRGQGGGLGQGQGMGRGQGRGRRGSSR